MKDDTPALGIREKDLQANTKAFQACLQEITDTRLKTVLDIRYGLGGWAKEIRKKFPRAHILGYEKDKETAEKAFQDDYAEVIAEPWEPRGKEKVDLLCADFNVVTVLKRSLVDEVLSCKEAKWFIFTDVACSKLHLNYRSYGLESPDLGEYWNHFEISGYRLKAWSKFHFAASTALFRKQ